MLASEPAQRFVARTLLGAAAGEELAEDELHDALCELANLIAGGIKSQCIDRDPGLKLGLPSFRAAGEQPRSAAAACAVRWPLSENGLSVTVRVS